MTADAVLPLVIAAIPVVAAYVVGFASGVHVATFSDAVDREIPPQPIDERACAQAFARNLTEIERDYAREFGGKNA